MPTIKITSDGTRSGTTLEVNGEAVKFSSVHFGSDTYEPNVWFSFSTKEEDKDGKMTIRTSYTYDPAIAKLVKSTEDIPADELDFDDYAHM